VRRPPRETIGIFADLDRVLLVLSLCLRRDETARTQLTLGKGIVTP